MQNEEKWEKTNFHEDWRSKLDDWHQIFFAENTELEWKVATYSATRTHVLKKSVQYTQIYN